ncbi:glycosyl transferase family 2 [Desulfofundulus kuznetsovii DSM 6115]|uniref:Glycosyl transferase family 2 n=1 Tax=Desulfofundulus kuznetsovii (strain DSM 6115 / VKM B-1805 / 17) TaxID=760568 RepID=A0AAU8Q3R8_DESK7|nr:glycosyl transferase family 2 [Desulfofundulus kuznetsovii DSM 6115]
MLRKKVSVVIATYNRAELLRQCLISLFKARGVEDCAEVIVVNNRSTDHTQKVIDELVTVYPSIIYVEEATPGLSHARNKGINTASGDIVAFIDDDVEIDEGWLDALLAAFADPDVAAVGGKVLPPKGVEIPEWLPPIRMYLLSIFDYGDELRPYTKKECLPGGNMAVRRWVFEKVGVFTTCLGRRQHKLLGGEEVELYHRIIANKGKVLYQPSMIVYHKIGERINPEWILNYAYFLGRSEFRIEILRGLKLRLLIKACRSVFYRYLPFLGQKELALTTRRRFELCVRRRQAEGYLDELCSVLGIRVGRGVDA